MNRLVIIGNGFDLAHGLKTSYKDFIRWYLNGVIDRYSRVELNISDILLEIDCPNGCRIVDKYYDTERPWVYLEKLKLNEYVTKVHKSELLDRILHNIESKGWTDIESDYYRLLKENADNLEVCKRLNDQMDFLKDKLAEYLVSLPQPITIKGITEKLNRGIEEEDIAVDSREKFKEEIESCKKSSYNPSEREIDSIMFLNFNYTNTIQNYCGYTNDNQIHGSLKNTKSMIFGYGDEMDKESEQLETRNENELMKNFKSIRYVESDNYRQLLEFISSGPFQVYIMGHSCGNSDRTLLNTIFEHKNCISIKPFYHKRSEEEGDDDYLTISQNIYRNFKDKALFRDRIVNKKQCRPLPQAPKTEN